MRKTLVAAAAALAVALIGAGGATAAMKSTLKESFATKKHHVRTSVNLTLTVGNPPDGPLSPPTIGDVDYLPAGTTYNANGFTFCDPATLTASGPTACPAASHLGTGSATVAVPLGGSNEQEVAAMQAIATSPTSFVLWGHGTVPIDKTVEIPATVSFSGGLMAVSLTVPLITTFAGLPDASLQTISLSIGNGALVVTPKACKGGRWSFKNVLTFNDNTTSSATTTQKC